MIPEAYLRTVSDAINRLSSNAQAVALARLTRIIEGSDTDNPFDLVDQISDELEPLFQALAESSASISASSYDLIRMASLGEGLGAIPYADRDKEWTREALYGIAKDHSDNMNAFVGGILQRMDYEAKRAAGSTQFKNGNRDPEKPRFARVPTGSETCPFCIMLASRGFVYWSEDRAGKLDHYHANCDCRVVPSFGGETYEGYDPDAYFEEYERLIDEGKLDPEALARSAANAKRRRATPRMGTAYRKGILAAVGKGEPMDFERANKRRANPHYTDEDAGDAGYWHNCQTCVIANEMRRRGYRVEARPRRGNTTMDLVACDQTLAWIDPRTGKQPSYLEPNDLGPYEERNTGKAVDRLLKWIDDTVEDGGRYFIQFSWKNKSMGHIVCLDRTEFGVRLYDPQSGFRYTNKASLARYFSRVETKDDKPEILRVDRLEPVDGIINDILREAKE